MAGIDLLDRDLLDTDRAAGRFAQRCSRALHFAATSTAMLEESLEHCESRLRMELLDENEDVLFLISTAARLKRELVARRRCPWERL